MADGNNTVFIDTKDEICKYPPASSDELLRNQPVVLRMKTIAHYDDRGRIIEKNIVDCKYTERCKRTGKNCPFELRKGS